MTSAMGFRQYVAITYSSFNIIGFAVNFWVLYVVAPLLFAPAVKVPKSILFYIFALCVSDLVTMIGMLLLIIELVFGTWRFNEAACTAYLVFDSMNKFVAPIIVFLISRTCYATVCLDQKKRENAASLKSALVQVAASLVVVMILLWPVFAYSQVFKLRLAPNNETHQVNVMRKCSFLPPADVEFWFNIIACAASYAIPLFGIIYWYISVPFFLKRRALTSIVASNTDSAIRRVIATVLVLAAVYLLCWTPYWVTMFFNKLINEFGFSSRTVVISSYFIHLLPYVSCVAYPVIFTVMNRGIKAAHAKIAKEHRRRFRSIANEATHTLQSAITKRTTTVSTLKSRLSSYILSSKDDLTKDGPVAHTGQFLSVANAYGTVTLHGAPTQNATCSPGFEQHHQFPAAPPLNKSHSKKQQKIDKSKRRSIDNQSISSAERTSEIKMSPSIEDDLNESETLL